MDVDMEINDYTNETPHYWDNFWENNGGFGGGNSDPDTNCKAMQLDQQKAWSKKLPNGELFELAVSPTDYLTWKGMRFGSDSIIASFRWQKNRELLEKVEASVADYRGFVEEFLHKTYTIGGEIIFPKHRNSINQNRATNPLICDRFDITLECIRRYYLGERSPLYEVLVADKDFFDLFVDFRGYVDFFLLNDLVSDDYGAVRFWDGWREFGDDPMPRSVEGYLEFLEKEVRFVEGRNGMINLGGNE
ncbi:hypothetical protein J5491_01140 [Candidatus Saccharibacteria bacterium]|nr:hypothetical protein [Candidatus Saccharibacteria bacterium]